MTHRIFQTFVLWLLLATLAPSVGRLHAEDWPQWRGPSRDGAIGAFKAPAAWPPSLTRRWQIDVGTGYATPLVVGGRVYTVAKSSEQAMSVMADSEL